MGSGGRRRVWGKRRIPQTIGTGSDFMQSESIPPSPPLLSPYNPIPLFKQARMQGDEAEGLLPAKTLLFFPSKSRRYSMSPPIADAAVETRPPTSLVSINNARPARKTNVEPALQFIARRSKPWIYRTDLSRRLRDSNVVPQPSVQISHNFVERNLLCRITDVPPKSSSQNPPNPPQILA